MASSSHSQGAGFNYGGSEYMLVTCIFFFQAEDGIRDLTVTGVQTCALPIFAIEIEHGADLADGVRQQLDDGADLVKLYLDGPDADVAPFTVDEVRAAVTVAHRSEERRVGKECRSRWSPYH